MSRTALAPPRVTQVKERKYPHFDLRLSIDQRTDFAISGEAVCAHDFYPFIGFNQRERQIDFDSEPHWKIGVKSRPIRYAGHFDAAIHSLYCDDISDLYEAKLATAGLGRTVLAYRAGTGSNIHFAKMLFDEIKERGTCQVLCYDIKSFFDSFDHAELEKALLCIFDAKRLTSDWLKVFRRLTKYEWVDHSDIKRLVPRSEQRGRLCSAGQFRRHLRAAVKTINTGVGIPQGSPLSGVLANIYMFCLDKRMQDFVLKMGGSYRRYSDDIAIVLPSTAACSDVEMAMNVMLSDIFLRLNPSKTNRTAFVEASGRLQSVGDTLQYLGFTFDGEKVLVRSSSLSAFYSRMHVAVRIAIRAAFHARYPESEIRRRSLVGRFTHLGDDRNFVQYCYRASRIFESPDIRRQLRNHVDLFQSAVEANKARYYHGVRRQRSPGGHR